MNYFTRKTLLWITTFILVATSSWASPLPCYDGRKDLPLMNEQVLEWKKSTPNTYQARAHIEGKITKIHPDMNNHYHFEISIGNTDEDNIEVIYNKSFGELPTLSIGMLVETCGDYITSIAQNGSYRASPAGAIIHWIHESPNPRRHPSGYLTIDSVTYGLLSRPAREMR